MKNVKTKKTNSAVEKIELPNELTTEPVIPTINPQSTIYWAIQVTVKEVKDNNGKAWAFYGGKKLYFSFDNKVPPVALFETKKAALAAIDTSGGIKKDYIEFENEYEPDKTEVVRVSVQITPVKSTK